MEKRFVVRTDLDMAACRALARQSSRKVTMVLWVAIAVVAVGTALLWITGSPNASRFTGFLALIFAYAVFKDILFGSMLYKGVNRKNSTAEYIFGEEDVIARSPLEESRMQYGGFVKIAEDKKYFFLYVSKSAAIVLAKKGFVEGKPEDFLDFLSGKSLGRILHKPLRGRRRK